MSFAPAKFAFFSPLGSPQGDDFSMEILLCKLYFYRSIISLLIQLRVIKSNDWKFPFISPLFPSFLLTFLLSESLSRLALPSILRECENRIQKEISYMRRNKKGCLSCWNSLKREAFYRKYKKSLERGCYVSDVEGMKIFPIFVWTSSRKRNLIQSLNHRSLNIIDE